MILLDTSGLLAALDETQRQHADAVAAIRAATPPLILSPFVLAELDYLLATKVGQVAELAFLDEVARGAYRLESFGGSDADAARAVIATYRDLELGLADASLVVLAQRHRVSDLLTLDERHFRVVTSFDDRPFRLLPADAL